MATGTSDPASSASPAAAIGRRPRRSASRPPTGEATVITTESAASTRPTVPPPKPRASRRIGTASRVAYIARLLRPTAAVAAARPRRRSMRGWRTGSGCASSRRMKASAPASTAPAPAAQQGGARGAGVEQQRAAHQDGAQQQRPGGVEGRGGHGARTGPDRARRHDERDARHRQADQEERSPAQRRVQGAAQGRAGGRGDAHGRPHQAEARSAPVGGQRLAHHRHRVGRHQRARHRLRHAQGHQHGKARGERRAQGGGREPRQADEDHRATAVAVPQLARQGMQRGHRDQVGGHRPGDRVQAHAEVVRDVGQGDRDHRRVQREQQRAERRRQQHGALGGGRARRAQGCRSGRHAIL